MKKINRKILLSTTSVCTFLSPLLLIISCSNLTEEKDWKIIEKNWNILDNIHYDKNGEQGKQESIKFDYYKFIAIKNLYENPKKWGGESLEDSWNNDYKLNNVHGYREIEKQFDSSYSPKTSKIKYKDSVVTSNYKLVPSGSWYKFVWAYANWKAVKTDKNEKPILDKDGKVQRNQKILDDFMHNIFWSFTREEIQGRPQDGGWQRLPLFYRDGKTTAQIFSLLKKMALAFNSNSYWTENKKQIKNKLYNNKDLKRIIRDILNSFIDDKLYYPNQQEYVNWWHYEIGFPGRLIPLIKPLLNAFSSEELKKFMSGFNYFMPDPLYGHAAKGAINNYKHTNKLLNTGGNLADNSVLAIKAAVLSKDRQKIKEIISEVYNYMFKNFVEKGDGFYRDGGFIQHSNIGYIGAYGAVLLKDISQIAKLLKGSSFDIFKIEPKFIRVFDLFKKSVVPFMFYGEISPSVSGRSIVRPSDNTGLGLLKTLDELLDFSNEYYKKYFSRFISFQVKDMNYDDSPSWIKKYIDYYKENKKIIDKIKFSDSQSQMWSIDRLVSKDKEHFSSVSYHSSRTGNFEGMNGENVQGFYQGEGMQLTSTKDFKKQYNWRYWWGVDPYELPGTTSDDSQRELTDHVPTPDDNQDAWRSYVDSNASWQTRDIAGGTTFGDIGSTFSQMTNWDSSLVNTKSVFNLEGQYLTLGNTSGNKENVKTTIDNRMSFKDASYTLGETSYKQWGTSKNKDKNYSYGEYSPISYKGQNNEKMGYVWIKQINSTSLPQNVQNKFSDLHLIESGTGDFSKRDPEQSARGYLHGRLILPWSTIKELNSDEDIRKYVLSDDYKDWENSTNQKIKSLVSILKDKEHIFWNKSKISNQATNETIFDRENYFRKKLAIKNPSNKDIDHEVDYIKRLINAYKFDPQIRSLYGLKFDENDKNKVKESSVAPETRKLFTNYHMFEVNDWHGKPGNDFSRLNDNNKRPIIWYAQQHFNRLSFKNTSNSNGLNNFAYSTIANENDYSKMLSLAKRVKVISNSSSSQAIEYSSLKGEEYLMVNIIKPGIFYTSFINSEKDNEQSTIYSEKPVSIIIKKQKKSDTFNFSARGENNKEKVNILFSKNIKYIKSPWIDWKKVIDSEKYKNNNDVDISISNMKYNSQTVIRQRTNLANPGEYFTNPAGLTLVPDKKYLFNKPIFFSLIFSSD